ncbi:MAG: phosphopantetheine-binding protein [Blastochloris sp.]|jgi:acyl carrier protein|nr:phosphopantetheine-binding protein [Blastochloris sp.]
MNLTPTELLQREVAAALSLSPAEVKLTDRLVLDLGAESLDLVDLTFRLEKTFHLQIPEGDLFESRSSSVQELTVQEVLNYLTKAQTSPHA